MKIVLMRHGRPDVNSPKTITAKHFHTWIQTYNAAALCPSSNPHNNLLNLPATNSLIVCSHLRRSTESAKKLGYEPDVIDPMFKEMEMPHGFDLTLKLPTTLWAVILRICWFLGYIKRCESFSEAKTRSAFAAKKLIEFSANHQSVIFVGHGLLNRFIASELRALGWRGPKRPGSKYWEYAVYEKL